MTRVDQEKEAAILEKKARMLRALPTELRRCLSCDDWMHSTGLDHRMCNCCKGVPDFAGSPVGRRITKPGRQKGDQFWL
jgi:hypothetical protein